MQVNPCFARKMQNYITRARLQWILPRVSKLSIENKMVHWEIHSVESAELLFGHGRTNFLSDQTNDWRNTTFNSDSTTFGDIWANWKFRLKDPVQVNVTPETWGTQNKQNKLRSRELKQKPGSFQQASGAFIFHQTFEINPTQLLVRWFG